MKTTCLIVGAGPTGLMAALVLRRQGIDCRLIDQKTEATRTSNALGVQARSLEIWEELGFAKTALERGVPLQQAVMHFAGRTLLEIDFSHLPSRFPFILSLPQSETEALLREQLKLMGAEVEQGRCLVKLVQNAEGVLASLHDGEEICADWVLGCDGYHSAVRQFLGADYLGGDLTEHFIMMDAPMKSDLSQTQLHGFLSKSGALMIFPMKHAVRVVAEIGHDPLYQHLSDPSLEDFQKIANKRCHFPIEFGAPSWVSSFWVHERITSQYRHGRVFLLGDAAHVHSPMGGQGMNTGMQDAYFLARKLSDVIKGRVPEPVLNTYHTERRPVAKKVLRGSTALTHLGSLQSPIWIFLRNTAFRVLNHCSFLKKRMALQISELSVNRPR